MAPWSRPTFSVNPTPCLYPGGGVSVAANSASCSVARWNLKNRARLLVPGCCSLAPDDARDAPSPSLSPLSLPPTALFFHLPLHFYCSFAAILCFHLWDSFLGLPPQEEEPFSRIRPRLINWRHRRRLACAFPPTPFIPLLNFIRI